MNQLDFYKIKARPAICLLLFATGAILCLLLDFLGIPSVSSEPILNSPIHLSLPVWLMLPLTYALAGIVIGLLSRSSLNAAIYGACIGQCQLIIPLVAHYAVLHTSSDLDAWWKALCGIVFALSFAGLSASLRQLLHKTKS